ncbi:RNA polymerase sigma factor [Amniculibacterium sp. G2-70]|nr:RNA polymerase sigma factor [Amniculibacterium sp. G2-70]
MYMDYREDQEDLFQEIVLQIWKAYPSFERKSQFSTWMYRIALNTAIISLKKEKRTPFISPIEELENLRHPIDFSTDQKEEQISKMYKAIHELNPIEKAIIFYYLEDYSGKEIAENMGISEVNARVKLNRAKQKLKELISK